MRSQPKFLPVTRKEASRLGIGQFDIIIVTGDAYVDHPSFGPALLGRLLWDEGYNVGIIPQPDWRSEHEFLALGPPRLFFAVSSGNVDSMVNAYTANRRRRNKDVYSPGGIPGRPDRAALVYTDRLHAIFPKTPIVLGGIEASLRRFAHYDYWSDQVRRSLLADAPAGLLVFGMGERQLCATAGRIEGGQEVSDIRDIPGTAWRMSIREWEDKGGGSGAVQIPGFSEVAADTHAYARAFAMHYREQDPVRGHTVIQPHPKAVIVQNPPALPLTTPELDRLYEFPYQRKEHPSVSSAVPALEPVRFSVTSHRGCFGSCAFCTLTHHQGRIIQSRSIESLVREVGRITKLPGFRGTITDVGGPTANMYGMSCPNWERQGACADRACGPECSSLSCSHDSQIRMLKRLRQIPGVKHVFISSGVRYDLVNADSQGYLEELCTHHVSGHLKVAPEHITGRVTRLMGKPRREEFERFHEAFERLQQGRAGRQYLLPYFMSGHPGCTTGDMVELAEYIRDHHLYTEQVQDFTPTPMSISSCMYHTGLNPFTMEEVHVPRGREKAIQRAMLHYHDPRQRALIEEGLIAEGRSDLIGVTGRCLIAPGRQISEGQGKEKKKGKGG